MVRCASSKESTSLQEANSCPSNDGHYHKNEVVIPVVSSADCTSKYYLLTGSRDMIQSSFHADCKNYSVHPHSKDMYQHLLSSPANVKTTSNMILMYRGLFTGRPPGFILTIILHVAILQLLVSNKSALVHPTFLETKSHCSSNTFNPYQVGLMHTHTSRRSTTTRLLCDGLQGSVQRDSSSSSERGVTTFVKEFEFEFTFEFESRFVIIQMKSLASPRAHVFVSMCIRSSLITTEEKQKNANKEKQ